MRLRRQQGLAHEAEDALAIDWRVTTAASAIATRMDGVTGVAFWDG